MNSDTADSVLLQSSRKVVEGACNALQHNRRYRDLHICKRHAHLDDIELLLRLYGCIYNGFMEMFCDG